MPVFVASHSLVSHKMTRLRNENTGSADFRQILKEITFYLGFEATRGIKTADDVIRTPMGVNYTGHRLAENVAIIPILRAGNVMGDGMLELLPNSAVHHIGKSFVVSCLL
jgi:uracil phosphoribosyltransferase